MKKLVSLLLVAIMVLSVTSVSAFAENTEEKQFQFKDKFEEYIWYPEYDPELHEYKQECFYDYDELYYHKNAQSGEIDWVLISVIVATPPLPWEKVEIMQVGERFIKWWTPGAADFPYGYIIYDVETDSFFSIDRVDLDNYDGFVEAFEELNLGCPLGDVDMDGCVTILDATEVQRYVAKIIEIPYGYYPYIPFLADVHPDYEMNIFDATAIQMMLASIQTPPETNDDLVYSEFNNMYGVDTGIEEIPFEKLYNGTQNDEGDKMKSSHFAVVIKSKEQYDSVFNSAEGVENALTDKFFEEKWIVASACLVTDAEMVADITDVCVRNNTLFLRADKVLNDTDGIAEPIAPMYYSFVAVDKDMISTVNEIIWL